MQKDKKFLISRKTKIWSVIIFCCGLLLYVACLFIEYLIEYRPIMMSEEISIAVKVFRDITLVLLSIFGAGFISALLIEVKNYNKLHKEIITDEVLMSMDYYDNLNVCSKKLISNYLDKSLYFNGKQPLVEMNESIKEKISGFQDTQYFYSSYSAIMNCKIEDDRFIKSITKTLNICSFDDECDLRKIELANHVYANDTEESGIVENSFKLKINGKNSDEYKCDTIEPDDSMEKKSGYNAKTVYWLSRSVHLSSRQPTKIEITYDTCVPLKDNFSGIRLPAASQDTNFQFHLYSDNNEHKKYKVVSCGFGFADTASETLNNMNDPYNVNLHFNEWIFPKDGWVIVIQEK